MSGRLAVVAVALVLISLACNGAGGPAEPTPQEDTSPLPVTSPNLPPLGEPAIEALRLYLEETGLDGNKGELTDPIDCGEAEAAGAEGRFCVVVNAGHYAPALAILFVTEPESGDSWQIHVDLDVDSSVWEVTAVDFLPAD